MAKDDDPYVPLFASYKKELRALVTQLTKERDVVLKRMMDEQRISKDQAIEKYTEEEGPLVHEGESIALIRKYWLEVARLKLERLPKDQDFLEPLTFLVEDLEETGEDDDLVEFLTEIHYWPIGLDENNEWC